jgi:Fe-S cluster biosynthesis and repair protein YggX
MNGTKSQNILIKEDKLNKTLMAAREEVLDEAQVYHMKKRIERMNVTQQPEQIMKSKNAR